MNVRAAAVSVTRGTQSLQLPSSYPAELRSSRDAPLTPLVTSGRDGRLGLEVLVEPLRQAWGAEADGRFPCPLPRHRGWSRLDTPPPDEDHRGEPRLLCDCGISGRWVSLGDVRAAQAYRIDNPRRSNIMRAVWLRRLAYELGYFEPVPVRLPELPSFVEGYVEKARLGFGLLLGLRWRDFDRDLRPAPYGIRFCEAWAEIKFRQARVAIEQLRKHRVIVQVDQVRHGSRVTPLYGPGPDGACTGTRSVR